jgi:DNA-binding IscR family transcriptional regulator
MFQRQPHEITVLDVVECVDGPVRPSPDGVLSVGDELWNDVQIRLADALDAVSIADLVERESRHDGALMFHI